MVIAAAEAMLDAGHNYQQCMHCTGTDIDIVSVHMAYIQCSLLHIPAVIQHGNFLSNEVWSEWKTPAHVLGFWDAKLNRHGLSRHLTGPASGRAEQPSAAAESLPVKTATPKRERLQPFRVQTVPIAAPPLVVANAAAVNLRGQLHLF